MLFITCSEADIQNIRDFVKRVAPVPAYNVMRRQPPVAAEVLHFPDGSGGWQLSSVLAFQSAVVIFDGKGVFSLSHGDPSRLGDKRPSERPLFESRATERFLSPMKVSHRCRP